MKKIIKGFEYWSDSIWTGKGKGVAALILDDESKTIDISQVSGKTPEAFDVIAFILSDRDVRRMIKEYQQSERCHLFAINRTSGMSGREDFYINFYDEYGIQFKGKKLLHVSGSGKLNEGWKEMYVGDFVELVAYLGGRGRKIGSRKQTLKKSGCKYVKLYTKNPEELTKTVTKIL